MWGLNLAWRNILRQSSCCVLWVLTPDFISPDLRPPKLTELKYCWLFLLEYHAREGVPDTHSEYRWVETSASSGVGRAGPQIISLQLSDNGDAVSMRVTRVWKLRGDILNNICVEFTCSPLVYLLNSRPMQCLTLNFASRWFWMFCVILQQIFCILYMMRFQFVLLPPK